MDLSESLNMSRPPVAHLWLAACFVGLLLPACDRDEPVQTAGDADRTATPQPDGEGPVPRPPLDVIDLPEPRRGSDFSLEAALDQRRSVRVYSSEPLEMSLLSQLLWATQGITVDWGGRTAPSAGATYPLEIYLVTHDGLYRYLPQGHRLELLSRDDRMDRLAATGQRDIIGGAQANVVITAVYARTEERYGERAERYVALEAGHACQNLLLQAVALDLGAVPVGAFDDEAVARALDLPDDHRPLYIVPVGHLVESGE